ncbi:MAG TPA: isocitrate lyase/phosphoenolpyruvate mutase family protein [Candidatus Sulfotelmatobacter sp.]|nr:isocitrate lyase/phosphoenolpyruvate mutase family protein [Candidatus Sulfotelmatobacter sp.]
MKRMTTVFREMLASPGIIHAPIAYDPLTAKIAQRVGFRCLDLGGYALGASSCIPEPLLSLEELLMATRRITAAVNIPLMVDGGAGFGDPTYVIRTITELERAGAASVHIEDQVYPKRIHYHKGIEHVISAEEMCEKIRYATKARRDPDFVIAARTDAMRTHDYAEGIRRANLYVEAGADMVMIFPNTKEEALRAPSEVKAPLIYVNSEGNRLGRPILAIQELQGAGYKMVNDAISAISVSYAAVYDLFSRMKETGRAGLDTATAIKIRKDIEDTMGLDEYYRIEQETVEARPVPN